MCHIRFKLSFFSQIHAPFFLSFFKTRLSNLEETVNRLNSQSDANEVEQERSQRINNIDSELQKVGLEAKLYTG